MLLFLCILGREREFHASQLWSATAFAPDSPAADGVRCEIGRCHGTKPGCDRHNHAYELGNCVGDRSEVLGTAAMRTRAGCHHLGIQPTAEEAPQGL